MNKDQIHNLLYVIACIAHYNHNISPLDLAACVSKLQRLAVSLRKRYALGGDVERLETRAGELALDMGVFIELNREPDFPAIILIIGSTECEVF